jgi:hypothetical protein
MARNQKRDQKAQQLRNYVLYAFGVTVIAAMVMGFVVQRRAHTRLGIQKRELEGRLQELARQTNYHGILLARHTSPLALIRRAESLGLSKVTASQRLFVTLPESQATQPVATNPPATVPAAATGALRGQLATAAGR